MGGTLIKRVINIGLIALLCTSLFGCSTVQQSLVKSKSSYDAIWRASIDSLSDVRYSASSTDKESGLVIADQAVVGGNGTVSRLNIILTKSAEGVSINVKFVPPPGTIGGYDVVDHYIEALKKRIPDIEISNSM